MPDTHLPTSAPKVTADTAEFWKATENDTFLLRRCDNAACGSIIWYPRPICPDCGSLETSWFEASGKGTIYSFTVVHRGQGPWADHVPYVAAYVELDEGPRIMTNIVGVDPAAVEVGMPVEVVWEDTGEGPKYYRFTPSPG